MTARSRVWSEFTPYERLREARVLAALAARDVGVLVAVQPWQRGKVAEVVRACRHHGVHIGVWPMLDDADGRWLNEGTASRFADQLARLLDALEVSRASPDEVVFDLEPDIAELRGAVHGSPSTFRWWLRRHRARDAEVDLRAMTHDVRQRGLESLAAVAPMVLWDRRPDPPPQGIEPGRWQRWLGTPVDGVGFDRVSVMVYTSLLEGYVRPLRRAHARWLLGRSCRSARARFGERASVSLGLSGAGALGDERPYRSDLELADDVAIAREAGIDDIALHGLAGALARAPLERWLDVLG